MPTFTRIVYIKSEQRFATYRYGIRQRVGAGGRRENCIYALKPDGPTQPIGPYEPVPYRDTVQEAIGARFSKG